MSNSLAKRHGGNLAARSSPHSKAGRRNSIFEKVSHWKFEGTGKCLDGVERWICLPSFYPAHVGPGETAALGKVFLGDASGAPQGRYALAKLHPKGGSHTPKCGSAYSYWPRTNRDILTRC